MTYELIKSGAFTKRGVCPCGFQAYAPFGSLFHIHREVCPECGTSKREWMVFCMRSETRRRVVRLSSPGSFARWIGVTAQRPVYRTWTCTVPHPDELACYNNHVGESTGTITQRDPENKTAKPVNTYASTREPRRIFIRK